MRLAVALTDRAMVDSNGPPDSWASTPAIRKTMQGCKSRDTVPELQLRQAVHALGVRYRVAVRPIRSIRRTADLVFPLERVAVFLDGCYWHSCDVHFKPPKSHVDYWAEKIAGNKRRDQDTDQLLAEAGWCCIRVWEHDDLLLAAQRVAALVRWRRENC